MKILLIILIMFSSIPLLSNHAFVIPRFSKSDLTIGPSFSGLYNATLDQSGVSYNFDIALSQSLFTLSSNFKLIDIGDEINYGLQIEATIWLIVNIGGGVGYLFGEGEGLIKHFFVGLPIPIPDDVDGFFHSIGFEFFIIEPYYRFNDFNGHDIHEYGLMVKVTTWNG